MVKQHFEDLAGSEWPAGSSAVPKCLVFMVNSRAIVCLMFSHQAQTSDTHHQQGICTRDFNRFEVNHVIWRLQ